MIDLRIKRIPKVCRHISITEVTPRDMMKNAKNIYVF